MSKKIKWSIPVPKHLDDQLENYIAKDAYKTKSEFVRTAVRQLLKEENKNLENQQ